MRIQDTGPRPTVDHAHRPQTTSGRDGAPRQGPFDTHHAHLGLRRAGRPLSLNSGTLKVHSSLALGRMGRVTGLIYGPWKGGVVLPCTQFPYLGRGVWSGNGPAQAPTFTGLPAHLFIFPAKKGEGQAKQKALEALALELRGCVSPGGKIPREKVASGCLVPIPEPLEAQSLKRWHSVKRQGVIKPLTIIIISNYPGIITSNYPGKLKFLCELTLSSLQDDESTGHSTIDLSPTLPAVIKAKQLFLNTQVKIDLITWEQTTLITRS